MNNEIENQNNLNATGSETPVENTSEVSTPVTGETTSVETNEEPVQTEQTLQEQSVSTPVSPIVTETQTITDASVNAPVEKKKSNIKLIFILIALIVIIAIIAVVVIKGKTSSTTSGGNASGSDVTTTTTESTYYTGAILSGNSLWIGNYEAGALTGCVYNNDQSGVFENNSDYACTNGVSCCSGDMDSNYDYNGGSALGGGMQETDMEE